MATINLGAIKFNWRGAYAGGTAYTVDDVVSSGGSSYVCILASTGNAVSNATYWSVMAQGGTDVATTITTQGDVLYRDGSGMQRLAKPASDKFLQNTSGGVLSWETVASSIVSVGFVENSTRYTGSSVSDANYFTVPFVKTLGASASKIIVHGQIPTRGLSGDYSGIYFDCLTTGVTTHNTNDSAAFKGINFCSPLNTSTSGTVVINQEWEDTTNLGAATHSFEFGYKSRDNSNNILAQTINPNSSDDTRMHQKSSTFTFYEVAI